MGGFESILNGATVYITNIIAALLINSIGSTEYFKKLALKGEELAQTQKLFTEQAATPSSSFFMDATYVILSLVLYAAIAILVESVSYTHLDVYKRQGQHPCQSRTTSDSE